MINLGHAPRRAARTLSPIQLRAIRTAMLLLVEDDLARGANVSTRRWCVRCRAQRPAAGSITYDGHDLCNACAIQYEVARASGTAATVKEFLR